MNNGSPVASPSVHAKTDLRIAQLDGLRGLACLLVVIHHCYVHCGRYAWPTFNLLGQSWSATPILYYGYSGVELFFILSGFCLYWPLLDRPLPYSFWLRWFWRRFLRIAPPYYCSILLFALLQVLFHYCEFNIAGAQTPQTALPTWKEFLIAGTFYWTAFNPSYWTLEVDPKRWALLELG